MCCPIVMKELRILRVAITNDVAAMMVGMTSGWVEGVEKGGLVRVASVCGSRVIMMSGISTVDFDTL